MSLSFHYSCLSIFGHFQSLKYHTIEQIWYVAPAGDGENKKNHYPYTPYE